MNHHEKGFSAVGILLSFLVVGLVGATCWPLWQNSTSSSQDNTERTIQDSPQKTTDPLSLVGGRLPVGWTAEIKESGGLFLNNATSKCFIDVFYTTDTDGSNSSETDQFKENTDAIASKGYDIEETRDKLTITTASGVEQLDAQELKLTGYDNRLFQTYAFLANNDSYTRIQLSCPDEEDIKTAQAALIAIVFNRE